MRGRLAALLGLAIVVGGSAAGGCGSGEKDLFVTRHDAGADAAQGGDAEPDLDPTLGGPCTEDGQCDDQIPCTYDRCDMSLMRCRNVPDDAQCEDDKHCDGQERCVPRRGCAPAPVVTCQDDDPCTIDRCVEDSKSCKHEPRDVDGDGDPDGHCVAHEDCDDTDPMVNSKVAEICGNFRDDDCDGQTDEQPCAVALNDDCSAPFAVTAKGTYLLTTVAAKRNYLDPSCTVETPLASRDIVVKITTPAAGNVKVWATAADPANEVAVTLDAACGSTSAAACGHVPRAASARAALRGLGAGDTAYAIITTQKEGAVSLKVDFDSAPKPTNEDCASAEVIPFDTPTTVSLIDPAKDTELESDCDQAKTGELTYRFSLTQPQDVRIFASTLEGSGSPVISIRETTCGAEHGCRVGTVPAAYARLAAGTYVFSVAGTTQLDASVMVKVYPPTPAPANQLCATAPLAAQNTSFYVDLAKQEEAIHNRCLPGGLPAAYDLPLGQASDVLVVGRFPPFESGAVAIQDPACSPADANRVCASGASPVRASKRNLPAGDYKVVIADETGQRAELSVLVRAAVAPTIVSASDKCTDAVTIPEAGGYFTGETTAMSGDFDAGCDAPNMPLGGARDQILRLDLTERRRVVLDMSGSTYTTLLDVRRGAICPGVEVPDMCFVGFSPGRSFLDKTLDAGTYWVQVDGYAGEAGAWRLDVRVLPP